MGLPSWIMTALHVMHGNDTLDKRLGKLTLSEHHPQPLMDYRWEGGTELIACDSRHVFDEGTKLPRGSGKLDRVNTSCRINVN